MRHPSITTTIAAAALWLGVAPAVIHAQVDEAELKAAFVFNFVAFVAWPVDDPGHSGDLLICVRAGSSLEGALAGLNRKRVGSRRIVTKLLKASVEADRCNVIVAEFPQAVDATVAGIDAVSGLAPELVDAKPGSDSDSDAMGDAIDGTSDARSISAAETAEWPEGWWRKKGVLSIADGGDAERNGAVITIVRENARIGFDVDAASADEAGLVVSSKLLRLARRVL
jgi:hypothetical protein